jgi:hypothetical protein
MAISDSMARPDGQDLNAETVKNGIKVPPELQEAYTRVVVAGMKVMFSKDSHKLMLKQLDAGGPLGERLGKGIAGLMLILFKESKQTMPPQVIIPAGVELLMQAVDFLRQANLENPTNKDIGDGTQLMITLILQKFGVSPEKIQELVGPYDNSGVDVAAAQMGGQPPQPAQQPGSSPVGGVA